MPLVRLTLQIPDFLLLWLLNAEHHLRNLQEFDHEHRATLGRLIQEEASVNDLAIQFLDPESDEEDEEDLQQQQLDDEDLGFYEEPQLHGEGSGESESDDDDFAYVNEDFERQVPLRGDEHDSEDEEDHLRFVRPWEDH